MSDTPFRPRRILVTGGLGTLGRPLVAALGAAGFEVHVTGVEHSWQERYRRCDLAEFRQLQRVVDDLELGEGDLVYHLAAEFGRLNGEDHYEQLWKTNVIGTKHLIRLQERRRFRVIFASSSEVYGELPEGVPYREDALDARSPVHLNDYAISKWVNEQQIRNSIEQQGTETMVFRFFNAYGPGERYHPYRSVVCLFAYRALKGEPYTVFEGYHRVFMYVDDLMATLVRGVERFRSGETYNVGGTEYRSVRELSEMILERVGRDDSLVTYLPKEEANVTNKRPDVDKAIRDLGHDPSITLEEGLPKTIDWMREVYEL